MIIYMLTRLILLIISLLLLVDVIRFRKKTFQFAKFSLIFVVIIFGLDTIALISNPQIFQKVSPGFLIFGNLIGLAKVIIFTSAGLYYCSLYNFFPLPVIGREKKLAPGYFKATAFGLLTIFVYSYLLFKITDPQIPANLSIQRQSVSLFVTTLVMLELAVVEEVVFRLGIQNFIAKVFDLENNKYWIAIIITSFFWTAMHLGTLNPAWVKFVQVFPVGIMLGYFFKKYGLESTFIMHGAFNIGMVFLH